MKGASERGWDSFIQVCQQTNRVIEQFSFKESMVDKFLDHRFLKTWTDSENWPGEQTVPALLTEIPGEKKMGLTRPSYTTWMSSYTERSGHLLKCI